MMDECAGEIITKLYVYDNRSCEHFPPLDIRLLEDLNRQFEAHFFIPWE